MFGAHESQAAPAGKYLSFALGGEEYAVEILRVHEISGCAGLVAIPGLPECARGVMEMRGRTVPVVSLHERLGIADIALKDNACVVVIETDGDAGALRFGLLVDAVTEVRTLDATAIEAPAGASGGADWLAGIGRAEGVHVRLLDVNMLLTDDECEALVAATLATTIN